MFLLSIWQLAHIHSTNKDGVYSIYVDRSICYGYGGIANFKAHKIIW